MVLINKNQIQGAVKNAVGVVQDLVGSQEQQAKGLQKRNES